ncbi:heat shock 70 kDa protein 12A-like [Dreissena polymorpha]|nr:heat shock 70 kDa protein 12A-like [Dreissena polymorpha]
MNPDKQFDAFGFEAEAKYKSLSLHNRHRDWYYFRHFKMNLHHTRELTRDMLLTDASGKTMKAMIIFAEAIKYVKVHLQKRLREGLNEDVLPREICWVLTVPAIWRQSAKQFMKEAASKAGIPGAQLSLALEPESAAIYCKEQALSRVGGVDGVYLRAFDPGERYIVVDCGGGTIDTTGHEVLADGTLRELHAATGGPWGGTLVNEAFEQFLAKMVTPPVFERFRAECASDWIELERDFENAKRGFSSSAGETDLRFPPELGRMYQESQKLDLRERLKEDKYRKGVELVKNNLLIKPVVMKEFFRAATAQINAHIGDLLKKRELRDVSTLLLVGGFSESRIVSEAVREFHSRMRVIIPEGGSLAILKGAVMFGLNSRIIAERVSPYTYGVHTRKFLATGNGYPASSLKKVQGRLLVDNAFDKHIEIGERVYIGGTSVERKYVISNRRNRSVFWNVFQSTLRDPLLCDFDNGCVYLGKLTIEIPQEIVEERVSLRLSMTCRGSELEARVMAQDQGLSCGAVFDFLDTDITGSDVSVDLDEVHVD